MKRIAAGAFALGLIAGIAGMAILWHFGDARAPHPESKPVAAPAAPADGKSSAAFEFGLAREAAGDIDGALESYLKALELDPGSRSARSKLASLSTSLLEAPRKRVTDRVMAVFARTIEEKRNDVANSLAELVVKLDPDCERAHQMLGDERVGGKWYSKDEAELARVAHRLSEETDAFARMTPREKRIYMVKQDLQCAYGLELEDHVWLDCSPEAPFLVCVEKISTVDNDSLLADIRAAAMAHFGQFRGQFGKLFDADSLCANDVCPIYVFSSESRYRSFTGMPFSIESHLDPASGRSFLHRDSPEFPRSLFHEFTLQILREIDAMKVAHLTALTSDTRTCWFVEGLTEYFEEFTRDARGEYVFSSSPPDKIAAAKRVISGASHRTLRDLMALTWAECRRQPAGVKDKAGSVSAQAWAATHFFLNAGDGKYRNLYFEYFKLELAEGGGLETAQTCFGDLDALNKEFEEYVGGMK